MLDWDEVYRRHHRKVYRYVYRRLRHRDDACDIAAATFVKAMQAEHRGRGCRDEERLEAWLCRIARNTLIDHLRWRSTRGRGGRHREVALTFALHFRDREVTPLQAVELDDLRHALCRSIAQLPRRQAEALSLYAEGYALAEVAAILDVKVDTVKSRIHRARDCLRQSEVACYRDLREFALSRDDA